MMPVIRISESTWERLKQHARPLEDSVDDVVNIALDSLDKSKGVSPTPAVKKALTRRKSTGPKLPQKEFRQPLMKLLRELGGSAEVRRIREAMEPIVKAKLNEADYEPVSTGEPRWWNATCWERNDLVKEGLFKKGSPRGVWELSEKGLKHLSEI